MANLNQFSFTFKETYEKIKLPGPSIRVKKQNDSDKAVSSIIDFYIGDKERISSSVKAEQSNKPSKPKKLKPRASKERIPKAGAVWKYKIRARLSSLIGRIVYSSLNFVLQKSEYTSIGKYFKRKLIEIYIFATNEPISIVGVLKKFSNSTFISLLAPILLVFFIIFMIGVSSATLAALSVLALISFFFISLFLVPFLIIAAITISTAMLIGSLIFNWENPIFNIWGSNREDSYYKRIRNFADIFPKPIDTVSTIKRVDKESSEKEASIAKMLLGDEFIASSGYQVVSNSSTRTKALHNVIRDGKAMSLSSVVDDGEESEVDSTSPELEQPKTSKIDLA